MVEAAAEPTTDRPPTIPNDPTEPPQTTEAAQTTEAEGEVMNRRYRDTLAISFAQTAILVGLFVLAAGVPTW